jgi:hypothetical protein
MSCQSFHPRCQLHPRNIAGRWDTDRIEVNDGLESVTSSVQARSRI